MPKAPTTQCRNVVYLSDRSGTGVWRRIWPMNQINCLSQTLGIQADYSQTPILDQNYYRGMNSVTIQRWLSDAQADLTEKFLKPLMDRNGGWLIYEIDDLMFDGSVVDESKRQFIEQKYGDSTVNSIPKFNRGRAAFEGKKVQSNIARMLNCADLVTVTTDYLKEVYHDIYGVPLENIVSVPNLLPRYMFGDRYDLNKKIKQFEKAKPLKKLRIGFVSSLSHFNIDGVRQDASGKAVRKNEQPDGTFKWINEDNQEVKFEDTRPITDDFDQVLDCIRNTVNDFQYVFFGYCPPQLQDLVKAKKIECHDGLPIMNYPGMLEQLQLQAIIAPIAKINFNFSKSFIKTMEAAAIGVPLFATNCLPYSRVMPSEQLFNDGAELKQMLERLKCMSTEVYRSIIVRQWKWLNSPCREGDFDLKNYWLEDNIGIYANMFRLRVKTMQVSFDYFSQQYEARQKKMQENQLFKNENILITK